MKAELISTGTELLLGQTLNTNAYFLSQKLSALGINVYYHTTVGDNPARMEEVMSKALERADLVITTGGLGPTLDDLTKHTVCKVLNLDMELHAESMEWVQGFFDRLKREMPENNRGQAYFPKGSKVIPNNLGTAPGAIVEKDDKIVIILPGPPFEMEPMYEATVEPFLREKASSLPEVIKTRVLKVFGIGESRVEEILEQILPGQKNPTIALLAKPGEIHIRLAATAKHEAEAQAMLAKLEGKIRQEMGDLIFAVDAEDMAAALVTLLQGTGLTIATAESCTGGLIGGALTGIPGSSAYYLGGFNTYSNDLKVKLLGVNRDTLDTFGAVSAETAREMATGARTNTGADIAVSVTGIAGPGGGSDAKPVGLVFVGLATPDSTEAYQFNFF
ncbi:MAG TPA: competence/damage-inducible protein A, partial [Verrucomicrobiae bacterium]|nr:competence/damage-inducible protein A [Verrucomicrobiae bacterium]